MTIAFTFPGQGSQHVGMGAELAKSYPTAARVFEEVDEALGRVQYIQAKFSLIQSYIV